MCQESQFYLKSRFWTEIPHHWSILTAPSLPKPYPRPHKMAPKIMKNPCRKKVISLTHSLMVFSQFLASKSMLFWNHFAYFCHAIAKHAKPWKYAFYLGKNTIFKKWCLWKNIEMHQKRCQNEGVKKASQNAVQKSILGPISASQTPP